MNDIEDRILDVALDEVLGQRESPDLAARVAAALEREPLRRDRTGAAFAVAASLLVCALLVRAVAFPTPVKPPVQDPPEHRIVFEQRGVVRVISEDGGKAEDYPELAYPEAAKKGAYLVADLSPDGREWIYTSTADGDAEIFRCDRGGENPKQLTANDAIDNDAAWTPDGKHIVWGSTSSGRWQIWVMDRDGSNARQLTNHPIGAWRPRVAPRGNRISYLAQRESREKLRPTDLVVTDLDGSSHTALVENGSITDHEWAPDGRRLACGDASGLRILDAEGKAATVTITCGKIDRMLHTHGPGDIAWKRDGSALACTLRFLGGRMAGGPPILGDEEIFILPAAGGEEKVKTLKVGANARPVRWVP